MAKSGIKIIKASDLRKFQTQFLEEINAEHEPVFITVNGDGTHVIMHIDVYNELKQYKDYVLEQRIDIDKE